MDDTTEGREQTTPAPDFALAAGFDPEADCYEVVSLDPLEEVLEAFAKQKLFTPCSASFEMPCGTVDRPVIRVMIEMMRVLPEDNSWESGLYEAGMHEGTPTWYAEGRLYKSPFDRTASQYRVRLYFRSPDCCFLQCIRE